jgi:PTS system nitrogen regulatory IIA component
MQLADILPEESVIFCTDATSKRDVLTQLCERIAIHTGQPVAAVLDAIEGREALGSTGLGNGIAIPHGKLPGLRSVAAAFALLQHPVDFEAIDDQPVDLVMMLLAPIGAGADHLKALATVARLLRTESVVERLRQLRDPARIHAVLAAPVATHQAA